MDNEKLVNKIIEAINGGKPKTFVCNGKSYRVTKKMIDVYKGRPVNPYVLEEMPKNGGFLPLLGLLPLVFQGLQTVGSLFSK